MPTQTRLPTGDSVNNWTPSAGGNRWAMVDDTIGAPDDDSTYVWIEESDGDQLFTFSAFTVPAGSTISRVSVYFRHRKETSSSSIAFARLRANDTNYSGANETATITYSNYQADWTTNPSTGLAWTVDQVNGAAVSNNLQQFGFAAGNNTGSAEIQRCTHCYIEVEYTAPVSSSEEPSSEEDSSAAPSSESPPSSNPGPTSSEEPQYGPQYTRRILHHGEDPTSAGTLIDARAIDGCWFELLRMGGPGAGEIRLRDTFVSRDEIEIGDWLSFEHHGGERWYLGRVEERRADSPAIVTFRLEGPGIELNEVFLGGFAGEGVPQRVGAQDLFSFDPDRSFETWQTESYIKSVVDWILATWVEPRTHILHDPDQIEADPVPTVIYTYKFRGEESARSVLKQLAVLARGASWGVRVDRTAFFWQRRSNVIAEYQEGLNLTKLAESRTRELLFNRILLTGDYIYPESLNAGRPWRARWNFYEPGSRDLHGERRIRLWVPWIRADADAIAFAREFFRIYAQPTTRYELHTLRQDRLLLPWTGRVRLKDRDGFEIAVEHIDRVRVSFDQAPRFEVTIGPPDPHTLWAEPPQDERWEIPAGQQQAGPAVTADSSLGQPTSLSSLSSAGSLGSDTSADSASSDESLESSASSGSGPFSGPAGTSGASGNTTDDPTEGTASSGSGGSGGDGGGGASGGSGGGGSGGGSGGSTGCDCDPLPASISGDLVNELRCDCADGIPVTLTRSGNTYSGTVTVCGQQWEFNITCTGALWTGTLTCSGTQQSLTVVLDSCDPFQLRVTWDISAPSNCGCNGLGVPELSLVLTA